MQRDDLATQDVIGMLQGEAEAVATSAALLMSSTPCRVPVRTKLATCSLLTAVLSSKEAAEAVLLDPTGVPFTGIAIQISSPIFMLRL